MAHSRDELWRQLTKEFIDTPKTFDMEVGREIIEVYRKMYRERDEWLASEEGKDYYIGDDGAIHKKEEQPE